MDEHTPTHELNGVLLEERTDASGRSYFWDIEGKKRARLDGQHPIPLERTPQSEVPDPPAPAASDPVDLTEVPMAAAAVAIIVAFGRDMYFEEPGVASAHRTGYDPKEAQIAIEQPGGGSYLYRVTFPETIPLHLTRIK